MSSKEPYGDVSYADPGYQKDGKKRYPIDTKAHAKAAYSYINQADNASEYTSEQLASIKARIKAALKKFGVQVSDDGGRSVELDGPAETTHQDDSTENATESGSAESTRHAPSEHELAKLRLRRHQLRAADLLA